MKKLSQKKVAIITEDGFEEVELTSPREALLNEGALVHVVSPKKDHVTSWKDNNWGTSFSVDRHVSEARATDYDAVVIPGGTINPDRLRRCRMSVDFITDFFKQGKPVAAICHGPQVLIETDTIEGRELTSFHSIKTDLINAGAIWVDEACVCEQGLVTSRTPDDLPAFNRKLIEEIKEGIHQKQKIV
ncbi:type 1 glutamine amidotransferase domain-containing protein [Pleomorphovibrio marinus]|uniref:type 1 glutamine amidotransferase domain-containing protein n=1 Tax=Pleomorphovibrio marinus TaxID=2164132 RepID=UPI000E0BE160|nr:type 1 glutamine amidotransferase domain-containing protein [Pleomorphovibrio marinus]